MLYYINYIGYDAGHYISATFAAIAVLLPFGLYLLKKRYKKNKPDVYEQMFAGSVLGYNDKCWYYNSFDLFRRGLLVTLPLINILDISLRASLILFTGIILVIIHCTLMPYRWRINNYLETFALC